MASNANKLGLINHHLLYSVGFWECDPHTGPSTLDKGTSRLGQGPIALSCLVEVERYEGELPEVTAFDPPPISEGV